MSAASALFKERGIAATPMDNIEKAAARKERAPMKGYDKRVYSSLNSFSERFNSVSL